MSASQAHINHSEFLNDPEEPEAPWFQVPRAFARTSGLSVEAMGVMTHLMSHSENFNISIPQVTRTLNLSKNKMYRIIDECIDKGYIKRESYTKDGLKRYKYLISKTGRFKKCLPCPHFQDIGNEDTKLDQSFTTVKEKAIPREREGAPPPPSAPPPSFFAFKRIRMTQESYDKLVSDFGQEQVNEKIEALDDWADIQPKKFKSYGKHSAVIRNWIKRDLNKPSSEKPKALNEDQKRNWDLNQELVTDLKLKCPQKASEFYFFEKNHLFIDKKTGVNISALIDHKSFCLYLDKALDLRIMELWYEKRFPNEQ